MKKKYIKKIIALISIVGLFAINTNVNAVSYNLATGSVTANTITINTLADTVFNGAVSATVSIKKDNVDVVGFTSVIVNDNTGTNDDIVITKNGAFGNGFYVITFSTDNGVFGSLTIDQNATNNKVSITGTVLPTLSMSLSQNNLSFGVLQQGVLNKSNDGTNPTAMTITTGTNATNGLTISMASANNGLKNEHNNLINYTTNDTLDEYYTVKLQNPTNITLVNTAGYANIATANTAVVIANSVSTPVNNASFEIQPQAKINNITAAGNYSDTLTFSVTGSF